MARRAGVSIEDIAAEVGRLFGTTEAHARKWLDQRKTLLKTLHTVRDRASDLIRDVSGETSRQLKRRATTQMERVQVPAGQPAEATMGRKRRRMSAATKAKLRAAAKRRWAERKAKG